MAKQTADNTYSEQSIEVLEGLEPVRKRPGMYIGSTGKDGLHHLIWEVVDNSLDEAMAGYADKISILLDKDGSVKISDNGRGIPTGKHHQTGKSTLETVLTTLHAGGKFGDKAYKVSGGLHGVGVSVVNALSRKLVAEVCYKKKKYIQEYKQGEPKAKVKEIGGCQTSGTTITFTPDETIFKTTVEFSWKTILNHLRQQAYLTKGVKIIIEDKRGKNDKSYTFYFEGGISSYVSYINRDKEIKQKTVFYNEDESEGMNVEVSLQYTNDMEPKELAFANNIHTPEGGMHLTGFRAALTRVINDYGTRTSLLKEKLSGDDVREGVTVIVSVKLGEPQFEGQTKAKLGNPEVRGVVEASFYSSFEEFLEKNPSDAREIISRAVIAQQARKAAKAARETVIRKGALEGMTLPGKLADCSERDPSKCELFLVEGDSAGGCFSGDTKVSLADGRDLTFKELVSEHVEGKKNYCYTVGKSGKIELALIKHPRRTKKNAEVVKVLLDNDEEVVATPDHLFMLKDGSYKRADELSSKESLSGIEGNGEEKESVSLAAKQIAKLEEKIDVYDLEVSGTHNFALASGVFVHNSSKMARNRKFQAILPLRGKVLNVEKARLDKALKNKEIREMIVALGTAIADEFDIEKLRYHRIIIMSDADVDGQHIMTLLLTLFFRYFPEIIEKGYLYVAQPPLYGIKKGKGMIYGFDDEFLKKVPEGVSVQRYKGLGEMNASQLWETTMDPEERTLKQVGIDDTEEADRVFDVLMGSEVPPRKRFIQSRAREVKNLDV